MKFYKVQASGNDFIVMLESDAPAQKDRSQFAKKICERKIAVGADGFLVLDKKSDHDLVWDFYNSDGSTAEMCGNASRAVAKLFIEKLGGKAPVQLLTGGGLTEIERLDDVYSVKMPICQFLTKEGAGNLWNTGVPHYVFEKEFQFDDEGIKQFCRDNRFPKHLDAKGANVSLWYQKEKDFFAVSFERGVEDFTLACGTGAAACGLDILRAHPDKGDRVQLKLPGGTVSIRKTEDSVFLIGDADLIFEGKVN